MALKQDDAEAHLNMGNVLQMQGKLEAAVESYCKAISLKPDSDKAYNNLGIALEVLGRLHEAADSYRKAITIKPDYAKAHHNLGNVLQSQGNFEMATEHYRKACALKPDYVESYNNLGNALLAQGNPNDAIECYRKALVHKPDHAEAHYNLGNALHILGQPDAAIESYRKAIMLQPYYVSAHNNLGAVLMTQGKLDEAVKSYRNVIMIEPSYAEAYSNLGNAFREQGKLSAALESYRKALSLKPDHAATHSNLLLTLSYQCSPEQYLTEARNYGSKVMEQTQPYTHWSVHPAAGDTQPLKVGLISGDLRTHPVGFFIENILLNLNSTRVELVAYSAFPQEDALTARIKSRFAAWNDIADLSDESSARKIYADGIHILIDLAGHFAYNRLPIFAWKPAPLQLSWLGYFASTGVPGIDYLLADPVSVPTSHQEHFTETVFYLPDTRLCFTPPVASPKTAPKPLPALNNGFITFGCFQGLTKINDGVLAAWGRILHALPHARLRLQNNQMACKTTREEFMQRLFAAGITSGRVTIENQAAREDYLMAHAEVDIILDTFPYTGGTTTCEALWMGVPTLTLAGDTLLARQGASLLACAGLNDWVSSNEDDYVAQALIHASDISRLAKLRLELRQKVLASPLFDATRFALNFENALQDMWLKKMRRKTNELT